MSAEQSERVVRAERTEVLVNVMIANLVRGDLWIILYACVGALCSGSGGKRSPACPDSQRGYLAIIAENSALFSQFSNHLLTLG
jgi:hypothetical protein